MAGILLRSNENSKTEITYSELEEKDFPEFLRLYEEYLNSGEYIRKTLEESLLKPGYVGIKAEAGGEIIGLFTGKQGLDFTCPHPELEKELEPYMRGHKYFSVDAQLVKPEYRHHHVAAKMVDRVREEILKQGCEYYIAEMWVYPDGSIPAEESMERMGRVVYRKLVPDFYKDLYKYGIGCPVCGKYCKCGALIEVMDIHEKEK
jgi:ribosomal protein S18 acetylase RimI-like enzyme